MEYSLNVTMAAREHLPEMLTDKYVPKLDSEVNKEFRHLREQLSWNEK